jgi:hypothetical protein
MQCLCGQKDGATYDGELFRVKLAVLVEVRELPHLAQQLCLELGVDQYLPRLLARDAAVCSDKFVEHIVILALQRRSEAVRGGQRRSDTDTDTDSDTDRHRNKDTKMHNTHVHNNAHIINTYIQK